MQRFNELITKNQVKKIRAIATSALRSAANGQDFIDDVKTQTGIAIEIIDGDYGSRPLFIKALKPAGCFIQTKTALLLILAEAALNLSFAMKPKFYGNKVLKLAQPD